MHPELATPVKRLFELYKDLERDKLSFVFNGEVSDEITDGIIRITEYNVNNMEDLAKMRKRVSFILLECFQNLVRHGRAEGERGDQPSALFSTRVVEGANYVSSINLIDVEDIAVLREKLTTLNTLEKDKLRALYMEVFNNSEFSARGGAGLGLIEIARRTGRPIGFDFERLNDRLSNFYLSVKLTGDEGAPDSSPDETLRFTREFDKAVKESDIMMVYKGDFGKESIMPIIHIIEERLKSEQEGSGKGFFLILVELLQNVSRHALSDRQRDGIFMIAQGDGGLGISVGNVVDGRTMDDLASRIDALNAMGPDEQKELYKKTLREGSFSDKGGAGLGLIEIARRSRDRMRYSFDPVADGLFFFTFDVKF